MVLTSTAPALFPSGEGGQQRYFGWGTVEKKGTNLLLVGEEPRGRRTFAAPSHLGASQCLPVSPPPQSLLNWQPGSPSGTFQQSSVTRCCPILPWLTAVLLTPQNKVWREVSPEITPTLPPSPHPSRAQRNIKTRTIFQSKSQFYPRPQLGCICLYFPTLINHCCKSFH